MTARTISTFSCDIAPRSISLSGHEMRKGEPAARWTLPTRLSVGRQKSQVGPNRLHGSCSRPAGREVVGGNALGATSWCLRAEAGASQPLVDEVRAFNIRLTIGPNSLRPETSGIGTREVMELWAPKSIFPNEKACVRNDFQFH